MARDFHFAKLWRLGFDDSFSSDLRVTWLHAACYSYSLGTVLFLDL